jgi:hypothetical protein
VKRSPFLIGASATRLLRATFMVLRSAAPGVLRASPNAASTVRMAVTIAARSSGVSEAL